MRFVEMKLNFFAIMNRLTHRPKTETMLDNEERNKGI
jgi:hypothetical protein